jgi:hypothetical protein
MTKPGIPFVAVVLGVLALLQSSPAQDRPGGPDRPPAARPDPRPRPGPNVVERLEQAQKATLDAATPEQRAKLEPLFAKAMERMKAAQEELDANEKARRALFGMVMDQRGDLLDELAGLLPPEQQRKAQEAICGPDITPVEHFRDQLLKLDISAEQTQKANVALAELRQQFRKARDAAAGDPEKMHEAMREIMPAMHQKLQGILTPAQQREFGLNMQESGFVDGFRRTLRGLGLNDEQSKKADVILEESRQLFRARLQNDPPDPEKMMQAQREVMQDTQAGLREILTAQQAQRLAEMMQADRP